MSATALGHELPDPDGHLAGTGADPAGQASLGEQSTEYATRGARGRRAGRPHLQVVSPLRPERASRGMFALIVGGVLVVGMVAILVINTTLAQGAFTISELQARQAELAQAEQSLAETVAAAAAPKALEQEARSLGMVPSENPVFLQVPSGRVLGKPKPAGGARSALPTLLTPADATVTEAVDNGAADLPESLPVGYDPAAADAAAAGATSVEDTVGAAKPNAKGDGKKADGKKGDGKGNGKKADGGRPNEGSLWQDSTVLEMTGKVSSSDAGLSAVPVG